MNNVHLVLLILLAALTFRSFGSFVYAHVTCLSFNYFVFWGCLDNLNLVVLMMWSNPSLVFQSMSHVHPW